jgi:hypothetical protein
LLVKTEPQKKKKKKKKKLPALNKSHFLCVYIYKLSF